LALKAESIRIERISARPRRHRSANRRRELITLQRHHRTDTFVSSRVLLTLALGKDIHGEPMVHRPRADAAPSGAGATARASRWAQLDDRLAAVQGPAEPTADADDDPRWWS